MKTFIAIVGFAFAFAIGLTVSNFVSAQNGTQYAPVVSSGDALLGLVVVGITSATSIIISYVPVFPLM